MKKIVYIDMDNVLVDFRSGINALSEEKKAKYRVVKKGKEEYEHIDDEPGIFSLMKPMLDAEKAVKALAQKYDVYILSTAPWKNPSAWSDKLEWVKTYFNSVDKDGIFHKRLILSHHKNLNRGDYLIDDRMANGADKFEGELILFNPKDEERDNNGQHVICEDWQAVMDYLLKD